MDEKIGKLLQNLQSKEGDLKEITGQEEAVSNLLSYMNLHDLEGDLKFLENWFLKFLRGKRETYEATEGRPLCMNMLLKWQ